MAKEWNHEETRDMMHKLGNQIDELQKQLDQETDHNERMKIIDEMMICVRLMSQVDTAHKRYCLNEFNKNIETMLKKLGIA